MYNVLSSQQSKYLLNSSNNFLFAYKETFQNTEDDFNQLTKAEINSLFTGEKLKSSNIDFILERNPKNPNSFYRSSIKEGVNLSQRESSLKEFVNNNPSAIIKSFTFPDGASLYYGRLLTDDFLNSIARKINANVAIITGSSALQVSNQSSNQKYIFFLNKAFDHLLHQEKFSVYTEDSEEVNIVSTLCNISSDLNENQNLRFLIFSTINEAADLRAAIKYILFIVGVAGVLLSLILTYVFTQKIRNQFSLLNKATELTKQGNYKSKIEIKTNDEIGQLASAFNSMLDELDKHDRAINEYSEFIALINKNPTLKEIADAALNKIIKTCGFAVGAIYAVKENSISLIRSYGIKGKTAAEDFEYFESTIKNHEMIELNFEKNYTIVSSGIISLEIKHVLIIPIIYNNDVIALIELGGLDKPNQEVKNYLQKIQEPLAIGMTNAFAFVQLENLVVELKLLNEEYQKQNEQVKQQNESLIKLHDQLKEKARELEVQKLKAEESTKLKSQFLASMSHELRTPMNSVLGLTELMLEESSSLSLKTKERVEIVHRSGKRLMNLINDILDLSKIEAGKMDLKSDDVVIEDIIFDVEASIKPLAARKHLEFKSVRKINSNTIISTDRGKVTQVLINLLGNAIKFTERGFVELHIEAETDSQLKFNIVDSGIGISADDQKIIFEEFRQIDGTTTRRYGGTGLGLSICKKIAEMLNGSLRVESQINKGSVFTFTIPLKVTSDKKTIKQAVNAEKLRKNRKNPILVIDDDADIRITIGEYLESKGYSVVHADNGVNGLNLAKELQPFAITLDLLLPNKDGWTVLKELKEDALTKDIPVILISIISDKNLGYGLGAFEYFVKPISANELLSAFSKLENIARKKIEKIVLVDDDEFEFERFKSALHDDGVSVHFIKDSQYAFNEIADIQPDLIVLDLLMPGIDGITLTHELKNNRETKYIPIIISTARDLNEAEKNSLQHSVENITYKSNGHPLDALKIIRDRIRMDELSYFVESAVNEQSSEIVEIPIDAEQILAVKDDGKQDEILGEVLIVDDDPDALFTVNEIVQSCKCKTLVAKNGLECLSVLQENTPDLILLDIMMPEMDGFQTIKKIRENPNWRHIPVLAVTARAMLEDRQIILKNGFDDYITKPVNIGVISFKIEKIFSKIRVR
jgi:CheY-like chemotaxis protein/signal transduction histidine kinase/methyl-accepting chemotaxis protein